ncbi:MAG: DUF4037 domain-containing protein [Clostridia bacterium]|nr:DUF4037 domain-containing protein [Clostridia bacterium]
MKGLELSKSFYLEFGEPLLKEQFSDVLHLIAVGLAGSGSECLGFDDEISRDHDFEPGFIIFLPDEDTLDRKTAFKLERAYAKLPKEYMGFKMSPLSPVGGNRHGVMRMEDFFMDRTGTPDGRLSLEEWLSLPEQALLEATNGSVFFDGYGMLSKIRKRLHYLPDSVRLKKLAGHLLLMGQSGQYNYKRCLIRGDAGAAALSASEFVKSAIHTIFLLNRSYLPYYKWQFRGLKDLEILSELYAPLEEIMISPIDKEELIEEVCQSIIHELKRQALTEYGCTEFEGHAYSVNNKIKDGEIRNLNILYGV